VQVTDLMLLALLGRGEAPASGYRLAGFSDYRYLDHLLVIGQLSCCHLAGLPIAENR
jgi:hypothetical protein